MAKTSKLRELRKAFRLSLRHVARQTDIPPATLSRIELGKTIPKPSYTRALYWYFDGEVAIADIAYPFFNFAATWKPSRRAEDDY